MVVTKLTWEGCEPASEWIKRIDLNAVKETFLEYGFFAVDNVLNKEEVEMYKDVYDRIVFGQIHPEGHRHDLGSHVGDRGFRENITQIIWPCKLQPGLEDGPAHARLQLLARKILGQDMDIYFDHMICKPANSDTDTLWHQDEAYWPVLPDKRSITMWMPLQDVDADSGCLWYVPGSHKYPLREHRQAKEGHHIKVCECSEDEAVCVPMEAGSCVSHTGRTAHYSRGNTSNQHRRAFIIVMKPKTMIQYERTNVADKGISVRGISRLERVIKQRADTHHQNTVIQSTSHPSSSRSRF